MPRPTLDQVRAVGDFATLFRWQLIFASFPVLGIAGAPLIDDIDIRCESAELPKTTNQPIEINLRGHKVKQPGITNYSNVITFTFLETTDSLIHTFIKGWKDTIWSPREGLTLDKADIEATIIINRLDSQDNPIWFYKLEGCWLEDYEAGGTLDGGSSDVLRPTMTLSYDFFSDGKL